MREELSEAGKWWFPEDDKNKFSGELKFNRAEGGTLSLSDTLDKLFNFPRDKVDFLLLGESKEKDTDEHLAKKVSLIIDSLSNYHERLDNNQLHVKIILRVRYIFLGAHVNNKDLEFEKIFLSFSNLDKWISDTHDLIWDKDRLLYHSDDIVVNNKCKIRISSSPVIRKEGSNAVTERDIKFIVQSLRKKSFENYRFLEYRLRNFLNFIINKGIVLLSLEGLYIDNGRVTPIKILFHSVIGEKMDKVQVKSPFLFDYGEVSDKMPMILSKWFWIYEETPEIMDLYFGVMYNTESYLSNNFLMLFIALEVYHRSYISDTKTKSIPAKQRIEDIYNELGDILPHLSTRIKNKTEFANKIVGYRNNLVHGNIRYDKIDNEDLFWECKNLQLVLQLCILSKIGFTIEDIKRLYLLDKIPNA